MYTRISDIAERLLMYISQLPSEDKNLSCYLKAESEIALAKLSQLLAKQKLDLPVNTVTLEPFKSFLAVF